MSKFVKMRQKLLLIGFLTLAIFGAKIEAGRVTTYESCWDEEMIVNEYIVGGRQHRPIQVRRAKNVKTLSSLRAIDAHCRVYQLQAIPWLRISSSVALPCGESSADLYSCMAVCMKKKSCRGAYIHVREKICMLLTVAACDLKSDRTLFEKTDSQSARVFRLTEESHLLSTRFNVSQSYRFYWM